MKNRISSITEFYFRREFHTKWTAKIGNVLEDSSRAIFCCLLHASEIGRPSLTKHPTRSFLFLPRNKRSILFPTFISPSHTHIYMYLIYIVFILNLGYKNTIYVERKVNGKHEHPPPQYYLYVIFQRFSRLKSWEIKRSRIEKLFFFFISHES